MVFVFETRYDQRTPISNSDEISYSPGTRILEATASLLPKDFRHISAGHIVAGAHGGVGFDRTSPDPYLCAQIRVYFCTAPPHGQPVLYSSFIREPSTFP
jgi:hypothetical protein